MLPQKKDGTVWEGVYVPVASSNGVASYRFKLKMAQQQLPPASTARNTNPYLPEVEVRSVC